MGSPLLRLTLAFTFATSLYASHIVPHHRRRSLPGNWTSQGCYSDNVNGRALSGASFTGSTVAVESCISFCSSKNYIYAGMEYADECYCDNVIGNGGAIVTSGCTMACAGNSAELCGGGNRLSMYWSGQTPPPGVVTNPGVGNWTSLGCYSDNVNGRALTNEANIAGSLTIAICTAACASGGYRYAGAEYAGQCYCGNDIVNGGASVTSGCSMTCAGNSSEYCGGPNRLNVYNYTGTVAGGSSGGSSGGTGGIGPVSSNLPYNFTYGGCWADNANGRILGFGMGGSSTNTVESCIALCNASGFSISATEYADECYCGPTLIAGAVPALESTCNMACSGNSSEACGGPNRMSVYTSTGNVSVLPVPTIQNTSLPGQWQYQGCLREPVTGKVFPWKNTWPTNNTAVACMNQCAAFGYPAAGVEYGEECYCGDVMDVAANGGIMGADSECNLPCPGDPIHICGSGSRLTYYAWNGTMNVWNTPSNTGQYEFFVPGVVIPLIATVGINNKVTFLEKAGTGPPNSTGAYELDLSLANSFNAAWRTMHVQTDVFCSGSIILPDKGGRQINVGGWSLDSTFGVRLYTPDGAPGVNSTNDWEENWQELSLQRGRWYPTAAMLSNGSILVIGGETGSNAAPQPSLEILPKPPGGDTTLTLDWLQRTDPNNLYPFVVILPSTRIFVGYWNEARILDPVTFNTVATLPNIPGSVNDFLGGRTYPLEGSAMPLPQHAPYSDPLQILICGGSTIGAGIALDNCVSIAPEAPSPSWTLERMPSQRVMPCMVALPDGTYMIFNGATQGVAGFGLANNPNLNAILYDPTQPVGHRFSILNNTIVARMYHSEATLLPDGRVLVSGSDPQTNSADGTVKYPEEYRIEVYVPPYLSQGLTPPTFTISQTDWAYGGSYSVEVTLSQGATSGMRVSLVAATSSTHGNAMGARVIFPAFNCNGNTCTITAPPNAGISPPGWHQLFILDGPTPSHSAWVRIGGDPAQLGNWPNLPGFKTPGV